MLVAETVGRVGAEDRGRRLVGWGLVALGLGFAANSLLGPFVGDRISYTFSESMRNQTIGLDAAALFVVAPAAIAVGLLTMTGHKAGPVLALGPSSYGAYMFSQYIAGTDHLVYPNVLVLQLLLFTGSWLVAWSSWRVARNSKVARLGRRHGYVAWALGGFVALRYLPCLIGSIVEEPVPEQVAADPAMYWLIVLLDLGVFVPVAAMAGVGLIRGQRWASVLHRGLVAWFTLVTIAVAAMSVAMSVNDDRYASDAQLGLFLMLGALMIGYAVAIHRPMFTSEDCALRSAETP